MAAGFIRRFLADPGNETLLSIEGVDILDFTGAAAILGTGYGATILVGESEKGLFNTPTDVNGGSFVDTFGGFGFVYGGVEGSGPVAARNGLSFAAPDALENWNGNAFVQLYGKRFKRLIFVRADSSAVDGGGAISRARFTRITNGRHVGSVAAPFNIRFEAVATRTIILTTDLGGPVTATFTAGPATHTAGAFNAGNTLTGDSLLFTINGGPVQTVTFAGGDPIAIAEVVDQINAGIIGVQATVEGAVIRVRTDREGTGATMVISGTGSALADTGIVAATYTGTGNVANAEAVTLAECETVIEGAVGMAALGISIITVGQTALVVERNTPGVGFSVTIGAGGLNNEFGWTAGPYLGAAAGGIAGTIPAGTRLRNAGDTSRWVTAEDLVLDTTSGPFDVRVRPTPDDGTQVDLILGALNTIVDVPPAALGVFSVTNPAAVNKRTEAQIDTAYQAALDSTLDINTIAREATGIWSARTSTAIRAALRQNALDASANGMFGRIAFVRPHLATNPGSGANQARDGAGGSNSVGATRNERVVYCFPSVTARIPTIALRGVGGGTGFTADGVVNVGWDGFVASLRSRLNPEENPGQQTDMLGFVIGLEAGNASIAGLDIADYEAFRAAGIAAPRFDRGEVVLQSGVTSVDPAVTPARRNIARRSIADFIQDSLALRAQAYVKKMNMPARRSAFAGEVDTFLNALKSPNDASRARIADYSIDITSGNTRASLALGIFRIIIRVATFSSMDAIVLSAEVGESVVVAEAA